MPLGSTTTRSKPRMAMAMSLVRIRRWWVSQSHPPLMVSRSQFGPRRSCTSMASTFTAPKSFSRMQTLWPCATRYRTYRRRKVVLPAPRKPVIRSTCTIIKKHLLCCCLPGSSIPQQTAIRQWQTKKRSERSQNAWWLRGPDLNQRPSGYEPDELPDCSTPRYLLFLLFSGSR